MHVVKNFAQSIHIHLKLTCKLLLRLVAFRLIKLLLQSPTRTKKGKSGSKTGDFIIFKVPHIYPVN